MSEIEIRHFHLFCGLGGGARGFNAGHARVGQSRARFRCIGGVDNDAGSVADFSRLAGIPGTALDLFDREQYVAWHGHEPPADWREATPADIQRAAGGERPHIVFTSPPCKGFSGLLSESRSKGARYQALNRLTLRGVWLALEAWADDPPEFFLLENVPRITTRGRPLLDRIEALLQQYGYATAETTHDCGELGHLAQSRRRFLLVARHREKVPPFLYEPDKKPLRGVGEILSRMPLPGDPAAGPMHRMPSLQWRTWLRLALVEAGSDWRSLERLRVEDGVLADYGVVPEAVYHRGVLGVCPWAQPAGTVTANGWPMNGCFSVADPRPEHWTPFGQLGVGRWDEPASTVTAQRSPGQGRFSVADPRPPAVGNGNKDFGKYRVTEWDDPARSVIAGSTTGQGAFAVADPRLKWHRGASSSKYRVTEWSGAARTVTGSRGPADGQGCIADPRIDTRKAFNNVYRVVRWDQHCASVTAGAGPTSGGIAIADPRCGWNAQRATYQTGGHYGVVPWAGTSYSVPGHAKHDRGHWSVADPRMPGPQERGIYLIRAIDGTWHRPFTTLELAGLQGLVDPDDPQLELQGRSDSGWRERIGNAVPSPAAAAIASVMGQTLLLAWQGETFVLGSTPIWVRPLAIALSVDTERPEIDA